MSALTSYRAFRREAASFDGATPETATYTQLRNAFSTDVTTTVGRFSPESLNRYSVVSLGRIALEGTIAPGDEIRIMDANGGLRFTRPASLESSGWFLLLPGDSIEIDAPAATAADIIIDDLTDPQILQAALVEINNGAIVPAQTSIEVTNTAVLPAYDGHLVVFVVPAVLSFDITLPAIADVALDSRITFVRMRGAEPAQPRVITDDLNTEVNGLTGVDDTEYFLRSQQDSTTYLRVPRGWARRQGFQAPQAITSNANPILLPAWQEGTLYLVDTSSAIGGVTQLPALVDCREGCRLVIKCTPGTETVHALTPAGADTINGANLPYLYTQGDGGSQVFVEHIGSGWVASTNGASTSDAITLPGAVATTGGQQNIRIQLAVDGDIVLPDPLDLPEGSSITLYRMGGVGTPRIITDAPTTAVNGVAGIDETAYYLNGIGQSITYHARSALGWTRPQGTGAPDPIVGAGAIVVPDYILGEYFVESTGAGGQTVTLPDLATVAVGTKVYMYNSSVNNHLLAAAAGNTILGAPSQPISTVTGFVAYSDGSTDWKGWTTP